MGRLLSCVLILVAAWSGQLLAQSKWTNIPRENSKIWIDNVPGLERAPVLYQYYGWDPGYSVELSHAVATLRGVNFPRIQVYLRVLAPNFVWTSQKALDEPWVRALSTFFKDRSVQLVNEDTGGGSQRIRHVAFKVENAECVAFSVGGTPASSLIEGAAIGHNLLATGYYCGAVGENLAEGSLQKVLAGIAVTEKLEQPRQRLASPPG